MQTVDALGLWKQPSEGVIVRSSATIEDGSAHSFAGIFESIPISTPEEFEPTVREIWASVFSPRALTYFREIGVQQIPAMAVVRIPAPAPRPDARLLFEMPQPRMNRLTSVGLA